MTTGDAAFPTARPACTITEPRHVSRKRVRNTPPLMRHPRRVWASPRNPTDPIFPCNAAPSATVNDFDIQLCPCSHYLAICRKYHSTKVTRAVPASTRPVEAVPGYARALR